jgi:hypothetical protein
LSPEALMAHKATLRKPGPKPPVATPELPSTGCPRLH